MNNPFLKVFLTVCSIQTHSMCMQASNVAPDIAAVTTPAATQPLRRQAVPDIRIDDTTLRHFGSAFTEVAIKNHALIVCEGTPLTMSLTEEDLAKLKAALSSGSPKPLAEVVSAIALAYDYDSEQSDSSTFLLRKRYSASADLPGVTCEEIKRSLQSVLRVIDSYTPETPPTTELAPNNFFDSLTQDQRERAKTGIRLRDLEPVQQQLAFAAFKVVVVENQVQLLPTLERLLEALNRKTTVFRWVDATLADQSQTKAFGVEVSVGADRVPQDYPLTYPFRCLANATCIYYSVVGRIPGKALTSGISLVDQIPGAAAAVTYGTPPELLSASDTEFSADPAIPTDLDRALMHGMLSVRLPTTMTLQEAAQAAETLPVAQAADRAARASAVAAIADKPVNVFGLASSGSARHFLQAVASVYGLQLFAGEGRQYVLDLPHPHPLVNPLDVPAEMTRLVPLPLQKSLAGRERIIAETMRRQQSETLGSSARGAAATAGQQVRNRMLSKAAIRRADDSFYFPAVRRLIALAGPSVPVPASPPVPMSTLAPEANRLFALAMLSGDALTTLRNLLKYIPSEAVTRPESMLIKMSKAGPQPGATLTIDFSHEVGPGKYREDGMAMSTLYVGKAVAPVGSPHP